MKILLLPIAFLYHIILIIRHKLYDWHILKSKRFDVPVICVGNLALGGTGKTPHTEYLIGLLREHYRLATLSRGYGRHTKGFKTADESSTYKDLGDEPLQYFKKFPEVQVAVDKDRVEGVTRLLQSDMASQVILLDDAFQHRRIEAGLNILLTTYDKLYCDDCLVPVGTLRDVKSAAKRADIIVVSKAPFNLKECDKKEAVRKLNPLPRQKVFFSTLGYEPFKAVNEAAKAIDPQSADCALLFCGIADPQPLAKRMESWYPHFEMMTFADHHPYTENDVKKIMERVGQLQGEKKIVVTTEKDYARFINSPYLCQFESVPLYVAPVNISFFKEEEFKIEILNYVRKNSQHC